MKITTRFFITLFCVLLILVVGALYHPEQGKTVPVYQKIHTLTQPDGTTFQARPWGDEWMSGWETEDGYTITQNAHGCWMYAVMSASGGFAATAYIAGIDDPAAAGIPKGVRPFFRSIGFLTKVQIVLLINFPENRSGMPPDRFYDRWFAPDRDILAEWARSAIPGVVIPDRPASVTGWYQAAHLQAYYGRDILDEQGRRVRDAFPATLVIEAVKAADAAVDFGDYDNDHDCAADLVMVVHQGAAQEETGNRDDLFSVEGTLKEAQLLGDGSGEITTSDACHSEQMITVNAYAIQPDIRTLVR